MKAVTQVRPEAVSVSTDALSIPEIVRRIYILESTGGLYDDKCGRLGKHNGYGFGQWPGHNTCFNSDDETAEQVAKWFDSKLKEMPLENALKLYSGNSAGYQEKFDSL